MPLPIAAAILLIPSGETPRRAVTVLVGVALTAIGEAIRLWGVHHIGAISRTRSERLGPLIDAGPFAYVRNPLYIGNILLWVGFTVTGGLIWLAPVALVLLAAEYHWIVRWEESLLVSRMGASYREYLRRVPRWIPGLTHGQTDGQTVSQTDGQTVSQTLFSERGTLIAIAAGYLLLWLKARF